MVYFPLILERFNKHEIMGRLFHPGPMRRVHMFRDSLFAVTVNTHARVVWQTFFAFAHVWPDDDTGLWLPYFNKDIDWTPDRPLSRMPDGDLAGFMAPAHTEEGPNIRPLIDAPVRLMRQGEERAFRTREVAKR